MGEGNMETKYLSVKILITALVVLGLSGCATWVPFEEQAMARRRAAADYRAQHSEYYADSEAGKMVAESAKNAEKMGGKKWRRSLETMTTNDEITVRFVGQPGDGRSPQKP